MKAFPHMTESLRIGWAVFALIDPAKGCPGGRLAGLFLYQVNIVAKSQYMYYQDNRGVDTKQELK